MFFYRFYWIVARLSIDEKMILGTPFPPVSQRLYEVLNT